MSDPAIKVAQEALEAITEQAEILHAIYSKVVPPHWFDLSMDALNESVAWAKKGIEYGPVDTGRPIDPNVPKEEKET